MLDSISSCSSFCRRAFRRGRRMSESLTRRSEPKKDEEEEAKGIRRSRKARLMTTTDITSRADRSVLFHRGFG